MLVRALYETRITPNHVTTGALLTGLAAAACYATGRANVGALLFCVSAVLDHTDGQLARARGTTSYVGHVYDRIADLIVKVSVFTGMGAGMRHAAYGWWALVAGVVAGVAFVSIFLLRGARARRIGRRAFVQPTMGPFELEDILYVVAPLTWLGWLEPFLMAAAVGAPVFAAWCAWRLWNTPAPDTNAGRGTLRDDDAGEHVAAP